MILCAERFDRERPDAALPELDHPPLQPGNAVSKRLPSGNWAARQLCLREYLPLTLFSERRGRRVHGRFAGSRFAGG